MAAGKGELEWAQDRDYLKSIEREIAVYLRQDVRAYKALHNNEFSVERLAYERGLLKTSF